MKVEEEKPQSLQDKFKVLTFDDGGYFLLGK